MPRDHGVRNLGPHCIQTCGGFRRRNARAWPREHAQPEIARAQQRPVARIDPPERGRCHRDVGDRSDVGANEPAWADTDDRHGDSAYANVLSHDSGVAGELPLPVAMADHRHQRRPGPVVLSREQTSECRLQAERLVESAGDQRAPDSRQGSLGTHLEAAPAESGHAGKDVALIVKRSDDRVRQAVAAGVPRIRLTK